MSSLRMVYDDAGPTEMVKEESSSDWERLRTMNKDLGIVPWTDVPIKKEMDLEEDSMVGDPLAHSSWQDCSEWLGESQESAVSAGTFVTGSDGDVSALNGRVNENDRVKEKEEVAEKLRNGQYILSRKERSRSKVWEKFSSVYDTAKHKYVGYVQCSSCSCLLAMKLGSGTSHLSRHVCRAGTDGALLVGSRKLSAGIYEKCVERCAEMCARDLRSFSTVSGEGFQAFGQELIKIGAMYGNVNVISILPDPTTVSQHISNMAHQVRATVMPEIQRAIHNHVCAFDLWTEKINRTYYLIVTSQYISDDWTLHRQILLASQFPESENIDIKIQEEVLLRLGELNLSPEEIQKLPFVVNEGSLRKYALLQANYLPCVAYNINNIIKEALDEDTFLKLNTPQTMESLKTARNIANFLKTYDLMKRIGFPPEQNMLPYCDPLVVVEMVYNNYETIVRILTEKRETRFLHCWNNELVSQLMVFVAKFKHVISELQNSTYPTLHLVLVYIYELRDYCSEHPSDHTEIVFIKNRVKTFLEKVEFSEEHYVATFLCPNTRLLKQLSSDAKEKVHKIVRKLCTKANAQSSIEYSQMPPLKKSRFGAWCQYEDDEETSFDEVALYVATGRLHSEDPKDLLSWWKEKSTSFPKLSQIARKVLCIPSASTSCKHIFNVAGMSLTERCNLTSAGYLNDLLVVHSKIIDDASRKDFGEMSTQLM